MAADGAYALYYATVSVMSGHHDCILVLAHTKESQADGRLIENFGLEPIYTRMLGLDYTGCAALRARQYMHRYAIPEEQCAQVVVKDLGNAFHNPKAQSFGFVSVSDVLSLPMLCEPVRLLEAKPASDGACAVIVAEETKAKRWTRRPVWVEGLGCCYDRHYPGYRDLSDPESLREAAKRAYCMTWWTCRHSFGGLFGQPVGWPKRPVRWPGGAPRHGPNIARGIGTWGSTRRNGP